MVTTEKTSEKYPGDSEGTAGELGTFIRPHDFTLMMQYLIKILDSNLHKAGFKAFKCKAASIIVLCKYVGDYINSLHATFIKLCHDMCSMLFQDMYSK